MSKGVRRGILAGPKDFYGFSGFDSKNRQSFERKRSEFSKRMNKTTKSTVNANSRRRQCNVRISFFNCETINSVINRANKVMSHTINLFVG